ncbi:hypothetical protein ABHA40_07280 [Enterococcus mundtii]|uniref:hypothetical protein n=1 Tax=Enterococcus mundtii TaxID=53346 RepID=UPI00325B575F
MSKSIKNILIVGVGVAMYLFTAYVYRHVSVFAEPLDQMYQSDSTIVQGFANLMIFLLFTPALRVISLLICLPFRLMLSFSSSDLLRLLHV